MSIQTQIDRISGAVSSALAALTEKGVTVPDGTTVDGLAALIAAIESGESGGRNITTGSFTLTSKTPVSEYPIAHGLGETPAYFVVSSQYVTTTYDRLITSVIFPESGYAEGRRYMITATYLDSDTVTTNYRSTPFNTDGKVADENYVYNAVYGNKVCKYQNETYFWIAVGGA